MSKIKTRRMYITPDDLTVGGLKWLDGKFTFTFTQWRAPKDTLEVVIELDFWWLEFIVESIHKVLNHAQEKITDVRDCMKRGD